MKRRGARSPRRTGNEIGGWAHEKGIAPIYFDRVKFYNWAMLNIDTLPVPSIADCLKAASDTAFYRLGEGALDAVAAFYGEAFGDKAAFIVADGNTYAAAGKRAEAALRDARVPVAGRLIFPAQPVLHAEYGHVAALVATLEAADRKNGDAVVPVAVGSGTVNDLAKRAAGELERPYCCVASAASVDGYTSAGAALLADGFKKTFPCPAPRAILADSAVLKAAPPILTASGWGDLAGKLVAGVDWTIAEAAGDPRLGQAAALGCETIDPLAWAMTQNPLRAVLARGEAQLKNGDSRGEAIDALFQALALTGFSMQYLKSSRPVSGCEHLFAHAWEMEGLSVGGAPVTHGFKVAIGTLIATALIERLFASPNPPSLTTWESPSADKRRAEVYAIYGSSPAYRDIEAAALGKLNDSETLKRRREALADRWTSLRDRIGELLPPYGHLRGQLAALGCPTRPERIGLTRSDAIGTAIKAQMLRQRYTALDLAWDFGLLPKLIAEIEADPTYCR